jgi:cytochrome c oxidase assembly protein Cox11
MGVRQNKSMYWKLKKAQLKLWYNKRLKQAQRIALAVVLTEMVLVIGYAYAISPIMQLLGTRTVYIQGAQVKEAVSVENDAVSVSKIAETIWTKESTKGQHNFSKCQAIGKINGIGYNVWGGNYSCFNSHDEEMQVLSDWIKQHIAEGMTESELLCHYSGGNYENCIK